MSETNNPTRQLKEKVIHGLAWKLMERMGIQGAHFVVQILIARMLFPEDYAVIALIMVFISVANTFVESGLGTALVQKKEADQIDCSSVFYINVLLAVLSYVLVYLIAPVIASFYSLEVLIIIIRVQGIILLIGALNVVQKAVLSRRMEFKKSFFAQLAGTLCFSIIGIFLAYSGYGVWALVYSQIGSSIVVTMVLWKKVGWRPSLQFSQKRVIILFNYGWKILLASLIETFYVNLRKLIIGKAFSKASLGYYDRGDHLPRVLVGSIDGSIQAVMFPAFASYQDERERLKSIVRRSIATSAFLVFPAMVGVAVVSNHLVLILLTEKWIECVPFLQLSCITYAFQPIHTANLQAIKAVGRSDVFLKLQIIKKITGLVVILISIPYGVFVLVGSGALFSFLEIFINAWPNKRLLNYSYREQWRDFSPPMVIALFMGGLVYSVNWIGLSVWWTFLIQIVVGVVFYLGCSWMFKLETIKYLIAIISKYSKREKRRRP